MVVPKNKLMNTLTMVVLLLSVTTMGLTIVDRLWVKKKDSDKPSD